MLTFKRLLQFPPQFEHREVPSVQEVRLNYVVQEDNGVTVHFLIRQYTVSIHIQQDELDLPPNPNAQVKIYCTCPSFYYDFAHVLYVNNCLLYPELLQDPWLHDYYLRIPPKVRNPQRVLSGCKHVIACARWLQGRSLQTLITQSAVTRKRVEFQSRLYLKRIILSSTRWLRRIAKGGFITDINLLKIKR